MSLFSGCTWRPCTLMKLLTAHKQPLLQESPSTKPSSQRQRRVNALQSQWKRGQHTVSSTIFIYYVKIAREQFSNAGKQCFLDYIQELMEVLFEHVFNDPRPYIMEVENIKGGWTFSVLNRPERMPTEQYFYKFILYITLTYCHSIFLWKVYAHWSVLTLLAHRHVYGITRLLFVQASSSIVIIPEESWTDTHCNPINITALNNSVV